MVDILQAFISVCYGNDFLKFCNRGLYVYGTELSIVLQLLTGNCFRSCYLVPQPEHSPM